MRHKFFRWDLLLILLFACVPLLWFSDNQIILGHDSGLTVSPVSHFVDRLFPWTVRFGFGTDQSFAIAGFFIHGLEALVSYVGFNLQEVQKITFIFWFLLPGLTMYYAARKWEEQFQLPYLGTIASIFYMINHFLLQGWFIAERTKFSLYAALPLLIIWLFEWSWGKRSLINTSIYISLLFFFLNGAANLPLFGAIILVFISFFIFYLFQRFSFTKIKHIFLFWGTTIIFSLLLQAYWFFPFFYYVYQSYTVEVARAGGQAGITDWLNYISQNTSYLNLLRLQGIPEWYQNPLHPYADIFLHNPILIFISFIFPIVAFLPLFITKDMKKRKYVLFFSSLALFSIIFVAGSHQPLGVIYIGLIKFVPGFIAFRTPFYKFAPALWSAYAMLIAISSGLLLKKIAHYGEVFRITCLIFISISIVLYSFPFLTGSFFDYVKGEQSMKVTVPKYVFEFRDWSEKVENKSIKILALPPPNYDSFIESYTWGYWSLAPFTSLLTNSPVINLSLYSTKVEQDLLKQLYKKIELQDSTWISTARLLGIEKFLIRKDYVWNNPKYPSFSPELSEISLVKAGAKKTNSFGLWDIYEIPEDIFSHELYASDTMTYVEGNANQLPLIASLPEPFVQRPLFFSDSTEGHNAVKKIVGSYVTIGQCVQCDLQPQFINGDLYIPLFTKGSFGEKVFSIIQKYKKLLGTKSIAYESLSTLLGFRKAAMSGKSVEVQAAILEDYVKQLRELYNDVQKYKSKHDVILYNSQLTEVHDVLRLHRINLNNSFTDIDNLNSTDSLRIPAITGFTLTEKIQNEINELVWKTVNQEEKKLLLTVPKEDEYELMIHYKDHIKGNEKILFELDNQNYVRQGKVSANGWVSVGKVFLQQGYLKMKLMLPIVNLYTEKSDITISTTEQNVCYLTNPIFQKKLEYYRIAFDYDTEIGNEDAKMQLSNDSPTPVMLDKNGDLLKAASQVVHFEKDFQASKDGKFYINFCFSPKVELSNTETRMHIKNIMVTHLYAPEVIAYSQNTSEPVLSDIQMENSGNTKVLLLDKIKNPSLLTFAQSYSKNWNLLAENEHILVNGIFNGWIVQGTDKKVLLRYKMEDLFRIGFIVSTGSATVLIGYLVLRKVKNK